MSYKPPRRPQFFYTTAPLPCPYVAGRTERKVVTEITGPDADALHDRLSRAGFRRSHNIAYAPVCPSCQACVPIRIPVAHVPARPHAAPDRPRQRAGGGLRGAGRAPPPSSSSCSSATSRPRHGDGDMATMSFYDYRAMVEDTPIETFIDRVPRPRRPPGRRLPDRPAGRRAVGGLQLFRAGAGAALARHLHHPVADRAGARAGAALRLSRLLGAGEPQDGLQGALPAERDAGRRRLADADRRRSRHRPAPWCRRRRVRVLRRRAGSATYIIST